MTSDKSCKQTYLTNAIRKAICEKKAQDALLTQTQLLKWIKDTYGLEVSQATISNTLKRSNYFLNPSTKIHMNSKRYSPVKYPQVEAALLEWIKSCGRGSRNRAFGGELLRKKAEEFMRLYYPANVSNISFSNGWLHRFKLRHGIKSFKRVPARELPPPPPTLPSSSSSASFFSTFDSPLPQQNSDYYNSNGNIYPCCTRLECINDDGWSPNFETSSIYWNISYNHSNYPSSNNSSNISSSDNVDFPVAGTLSPSCLYPSPAFLQGSPVTINKVMEAVSIVETFWVQNQKDCFVSSTQKMKEYLLQGVLGNYLI